MSSSFSSTYNKAKLQKDNVPPWNQEVFDEQGRKRLHGAFKGGFSAGYFNTVGTNEGWQPADFVSSRNQRAKLNKTSAVQYMDEEDIEEQLEAWELAAQSESLPRSSLKSNLKIRGGIGVGVLNEDVYNEDVEVYDEQLSNLTDFIKNTGKSTKKRKVTSDLLEELHTSKRSDYSNPSSSSGPLIVELTPQELAQLDTSSSSTSTSTTTTYTRFPISKQLAKAALKKSNPFTGSKQLRYKQYLEYHAGLSNFLPPITTDAEDQEDKLFAAIVTQAFPTATSTSASIVKDPPLFFASKFTSSHYQEGEQETHLPPSSSSSSTTDPTHSSTSSLTKSTSVSFQFKIGTSNRLIEPFAPVRLLCKRFRLTVQHTHVMKESGQSKEPKPILDPNTLQQLVNESLFQRALAHELNQKQPLQPLQPQLLLQLQPKREQEKRDSSSFLLSKHSSQVQSDDLTSSSSSSSTSVSTKKDPSSYLDTTISSSLSTSTSNGSTLLASNFKPIFIPKSDINPNTTTLSSTSSNALSIKENNLTSSTLRSTSTTTTITTSLPIKKKSLKKDTSTHVRMSFNFELD